MEEIHKKINEIFIANYGNTIASQIEVTHLVSPVNEKMLEFKQKMKEHLSKDRQDRLQKLFPNLEQLRKEIEQLQQKLVRKPSQHQLQIERAKLINKKNKLLNTIQQQNRCIQKYKKELTQLGIQSDELDNQIHQNQITLKNINPQLTISLTNKQRRQSQFKPKQPFSEVYPITHSQGMAHQSIILPKIKKTPLMSESPQSAHNEQGPMFKKTKSIFMENSFESALKKMTSQSRMTQSNLQKQNSSWKTADQLLDQLSKSKSSYFLQLLLDEIKAENGGNLRQIFKNYRAEGCFRQFLLKPHIKKALNELVDSYNSQ